MSNHMAVTVIQICVGLVAFVGLVAWLDLVNQKRAKRRATIARIKRHLEPIRPEWIDPAAFDRDYRRPLGASRHVA